MNEKANILTLAGLFHGRIFEVPDYQRGYDWEQKQWKDFWLDIVNLLEDQRHYIGTLVFHETGSIVEESSRKRFTKCDIVDGQQRLTTILILLQILREEMLEFSPDQKKFISNIEENFLWIDSEGDIRWRTYLTLNHENKDFFSNVILSKEVLLIEMKQENTCHSNSEKKLLEAKSFFKNCLHSLVEKKLGLSLSVPDPMFGMKQVTRSKKRKMGNDESPSLSKKPKPQTDASEKESLKLISEKPSNVTSPGSIEEEEEEVITQWRCRHCTLFNSYSFNKCMVCNNEKLVIDLNQNDSSNNNNNSIANPAPSKTGNFLNNDEGNFKNAEERKIKKKPEMIHLVKSIFDKLMNQLYFNIYIVSSNEDVGIIFEVLNNRGKPLSELEKIKNYLLYIVRKKEIPLRERINQIWSEVLRNLHCVDITSSNQEDNLVHDLWVLLSPTQVNKNTEIANSIKLALPIEAKPEDIKSKIDEFLDTLPAIVSVHSPFFGCKKDFEEVFESKIKDRPTQRKVAIWLKKLYVLGKFEVFIPTILALYLCPPENPIEIEEVLKQFEKLCVTAYYFARRTPYNAGSRILDSAARKYYVKQMKCSELITEISNLTKKYSKSAQEFFSKIGETDLNTHSNRLLMKYILYEYEEYLARCKFMEPSFPFEDVDLDYIFPLYKVNVHPSWLTKWEKEINNHKYILHDIGNLTLRSKVGVTLDLTDGKVFTDKREYYLQSPLEQVNSLGHYSSWNPEDFHKRRNEILQWANTRWPLLTTTVLSGFQVEDESTSEDV